MENSPTTICENSPYSPSDSGGIYPHFYSEEIDACNSEPGASVRNRWQWSYSAWLCSLWTSWLLVIQYWGTLPIETLRSSSPAEPVALVAIFYFDSNSQQSVLEKLFLRHCNFLQQVWIFKGLFQTLLMPCLLPCSSALCSRPWVFWGSYSCKVLNATPVIWVIPL